MDLAGIDRRRALPGILLHTDVIQAINGIMTPDRQPKVNVDRFAAANRDGNG